MEEAIENEIERIEEENTLESYLIPGSNSAGIGSYTENDLRSSMQSLQGRLRSMGISPLGDLFKEDVDSIRSTMKW